MQLMSYSIYREARNKERQFQDRRNHKTLSVDARLLRNGIIPLEKVNSLMGVWLVWEPPSSTDEGSSTAIHP
jgi:hypothetical protein